MLRAIESTSDMTFYKINELVSVKDSIPEFVKNDNRKFRNPENLIVFLFRQPFTKVNHLVDAGIYAENTSGDYLIRLCELKVLEKKEIEGDH